MKTLSLKIDDSIFGEMENILAVMKKPGNKYINDTIEYCNKHQKRVIVEKKLMEESELVKEDTIAFLKEFE